uniref:Uncharacterized protein n=1 Tax=Tetranychus urticae TaxID=32264 RepID=T1JQQ9_TETUR
MASFNQRASALNSGRYSNGKSGFFEISSISCNVSSVPDGIITLFSAFRYTCGFIIDGNEDAEVEAEAKEEEAKEEVKGEDQEVEAEAKEEAKGEEEEVEDQDEEVENDLDKDEYRAYTKTF